MSIELPGVLKSFDLYLNGRNFSGTCDKVTLPKNTPKFEVLNASGLTRPLKINVGSEDDWSLSFSKNGLDLSLLTEGDCKIDGQELLFRGSVSMGDSCEEIPVKIYAWGQIGETDQGDLEVNKLAKNEVKIEVARIQYFVNEKEVYFEDVINMIRRINGVDVLEKRRRNLGRK